MTTRLPVWLRTSQRRGKSAAARESGGLFLLQSGQFRALQSSGGSERRGRLRQVTTVSTRGELRMNKGDLAAAVADKTDMSKAAANSAVEAVFEVIADSLKKGEE